VKKNKGRSTIGGVPNIVEDTSSTPLDFFTDEWNPYLIFYGYYNSCVISNEMAADGSTSLKCDLYNSPTYLWWGAYFNWTAPTANRDVSLYTHFRVKVRAAPGYGQIQLVASCGQAEAYLHSPDYSPDGLSIDDQKWRTLYIPLADLGLLPGMTINGTGIYNSGVKPTVFYVDSVALVKISSSSVQSLTYPTVPFINTSRTSGYYGLSDTGVINTVNTVPTSTDSTGSKHNNALTLTFMALLLLIVTML